MLKVGSKVRLRASAAGQLFEDLAMRKLTVRDVGTVTGLYADNHVDVSFGYAPPQNFPLDLSEDFLEEVVEEKK